MGRFEDYPGLVGTGVQLLENRLGATPQGFESLPLRHLYLHFQGYYRSSVLEAVNKIIYHTAKQMQAAPL